ncbi:MAG: hypothetical protein LUO94_11255 [Methylococcaceae bacterium]|nr:hypothetical protein [Methylococcaceae bacterium]MDD1630944.1 hypothetical protein [Methylococcaceae bacterium]
MSEMMVVHEVAEYLRIKERKICIPMGMLADVVTKKGKLIDRQSGEAVRFC